MEQERLAEQVRNDYLSGRGSYRTLAARYGFSVSTIHRIVMGNNKKGTKRRATRVEGWVQSIPGEEQLMPAEVNGLQEELRIARLKIALLEAMIDIADEQMGANIRKKAGARQS